MVPPATIPAAVKLEGTESQVAPPGHAWVHIHELRGAPTLCQPSCQEHWNPHLDGCHLCIAPPAEVLELQGLGQAHSVGHPQAWPPSQLQAGGSQR